MSVRTPIFTTSSETRCAWAAPMNPAHSAAQRMNLVISSSSVARRSRGDARRLRLAADRRLRPARFARLQPERELERIRTVRLSYVVADQRLGDAELAVGLEVRILGVVDLGGDGLEARLVDE